MPAKKYPLKPLLEHRERQVDDATAELGGAVRAREAADVARARADSALSEAEERADRVRAAERDRLERGELRVADLARADAWDAGVRAHIGQLANAALAADAKLETARAEEAEARAELARRMTDRDVVSKDEDRFVERSNKRALASEEEAAEEAFRGGRR